MDQSSKKHDAIEMLTQDHRTVQGLFDDFEQAEDDQTKQSLVDNIMTELEAHTALEEEIFYPAVRGQIKGDLVDEAVEEHHLAKVLLEELEGMTSHDEHYDAKGMVLCESIAHHVKEEESEMFPKVKKSGLDLEDLGERMAERKQELMGRDPSSLGAGDRPPATRPGA